MQVHNPCGDIRDARIARGSGDAVLDAFVLRRIVGWRMSLADYGVPPGQGIVAAMPITILRF